MRRLVVVLSVVAFLGVSACVDDDDTSTSDGSDTSVYDPEPTPEAAEGCTDSHPRRVTEPSALRGFIVLCDQEGGMSMTIENISDVAVVDVNPDGQTWATLDVTEAPQPRFPQQVALRVAQPTCDGMSCVVPAGSTLQVSTAEPVRALLDIRKGDTYVALLAASIQNQINARLGTPGQRLGSQALACSREAADVFDGATWEERIRNGLEGATSCSTLAQQLDGGDPAARTGIFNRIAARARQYAGGSINDLLLLTAKLVAPG